MLLAPLAVQLCLMDHSGVYLEQQSLQPLTSHMHSHSIFEKDKNHVSGTGTAALAGLLM